MKACKRMKIHLLSWMRLRCHHKLEVSLECKVEVWFFHEAGQFLARVSGSDPGGEGFDLWEGLFWSHIIKNIPVENPQITVPLFSLANFNSVKWVLPPLLYLVWALVWCFANVHSCTFRGPLFLQFPLGLWQIRSILERRSAKKNKMSPHKVQIKFCCVASFFFFPLLPFHRMFS